MICWIILNCVCRPSPTLLILQPYFIHSFPSHFCVSQCLGARPRAMGHMQWWRYHENLDTLRPNIYDMLSHFSWMCVSLSFSWFHGRHVCIDSLLYLIILTRNHSCAFGCSGTTGWRGISRHSSGYIASGRFCVIAISVPPLIARFMGPIWDPPGDDRTQWVQCWPYEPCYLGPDAVAYGLRNISRYSSYCTVSVDEDIFPIFCHTLSNINAFHITDDSISRRPVFS